MQCRSLPWSSAALSRSSPANQCRGVERSSAFSALAEHSVIAWYSASAMPRRTSIVVGSLMAPPGSRRR